MDNGGSRASGGAARRCFDVLHELLAARRDVLAAEQHVARRAAVLRHVTALQALQRLARELGPCRDADGVDPLTAQRIAVACDIARVQPLAAAARTYDEIRSTAAELDAAIELATSLDALGAPATGARRPAPAGSAPAATAA